MKKSNQFFLFALLFLFVLIIYFPAHQAGFVTDFLGWQNKFNQEPITGALTTFGWHANQQASVFFFYLLYKLFNLNGWPWYISFTLLHTINGFLSYRLFCRILKECSVSNASITAFIGTLLFLLSPYQAEVLVWRVCVHYLLSTLCILLVLTLTWNFLQTRKGKDLWWMQVIFLLSLFTLEITLITPVMIFVLVIIHHSIFNKGTMTWRNILILLAPQIIFIGGYFVINKLILGQWVGHYGADTHFRLSFHDIFSNYFRYLFKYLFFTRYFEHSLKMKIFSTAETTSGIAVMLSIFMLLFLYALIFYNLLHNRLRIAGMSLLLFFISLTPIITLYMVTLMHGENDRYGYLASIFFWMTVSVLFAALPKRLFYGIALILILISVLLLWQTNRWWCENTKIYYSLLDDFRWYEKDEVVILNIPDNYQGLYMYRIYNEPSGFKEALALIRKKPFNGQMREVTQFNMMAKDQGVHVTVDSINNLTVTFNQYGNWWWWEGIGISDYENEHYKVDFEGNAYHLLLKSLKPNSAIIYQVGDKWEQVNADWRH